ncbi:centlein [Gadus chalcogrammus]|uniref:centlein n=1 Tax=Gadus chalcogrammus TaxID=1042646 RepID=UPI0024C2E389|nr:centlein [Gadus chalcogrammus]
MDPNSIELLEAQVKTLSDELMQCQADKEFVWSLWKRLQVANPDLTQAVSLVVEREKQKGEMKDRKVLEILQTKDYKIQELEQRVTVQQQEVNLVQQRKMLMDEERAALNKEISSLQERLASNSQDIKEMRAQHASSEEEARGAMRALEEQKEEWASRCAGLHADLEEERRRASHCDDQREATRARIKELEAELPQFSSLQSENSSLAALLSAKDKEMEAQEGHLSQLRGELVEVQALYRQSMEHGSEQGHLIKQLEALNLDSQRVLRNQEEAHSVDATSYQRLYTELSQSYQALVAGEAQLRQNHLELSGLLAQRDLQILELQSQLQQQDLLAHRDQQILELHSQLQQQQQQQQEKRLLQTQQQQQQAHQTTTTAGQQPNKQTNVKELCQPSADTPVSSGFNQASNFSSPGLGTSTPLDGGAWTERTWKASSSRGRSTSIGQQDAPVQRSRSLSPASCVEAGGGGGGGGREGGGAEQRMQDLEELLQLKTKEMEVLRSAHQNRLERLHLIQANYRTIRDQLRDAEEADGLPKPKGPSRRAEPWQLRQEDSDGVWNELAYFKRLARKLDVEKANLEEEMDVLKVQAALDRTTVKEQRLCLLNEHQELLCRVEEERRVRQSAPKPQPAAASQRVEESLRKMEQLERRMISLEEETEKLRLENEHLLEAREELTNERRHLRASLENLHCQADARERAARAQALAQRERHSGETQALEARLGAAEKEAAQLRGRALKLRQELGILRAARDFYRRSTAAGGGGGGGAVGADSSKVKFKTARLAGPACRSGHRAVGPNQAISWHGRSPSPAKDEWEDVSTDSEGDEVEFSDSLEGNRSKTRRASRTTPKMPYRCTAGSNVASERAEDEPGRRHASGPSPDERKWRAPGDQAETSGEARMRGAEMMMTTAAMMKRRRKMATAGSTSTALISLQHRVESLQRRVDILRRARRDATRMARETGRANQNMAAQLDALTDRLGGNKQLTQKLTCDLAGVELQKKVLEMELEQWRKMQLPPPPPPPPPPAPPAAATGAAESCSCQGRGLTAPNNLGLQALEAEVKQLQGKLKSGSAEASRQASAIKTLRAQVQDKEDKLRMLQDKASHSERDVVMKRQLVEDLRTRLKVLQDGEGSHRGQVEDLERKVKSQSEEANNRKTFIESLKRRLSVATSEKSHHETSCTKLREELERKVRLLETLQAQVGAEQRSLAQLEQTATRQMEGLTQQSSQALDVLQRRLGLASSQKEQLHAFVKALAGEMLRDVQEVKQQLTETRSRRKRSRRRHEEANAARGAPAAKSMIRAKSIAASILNMSERDLADMLDGDQDETEPCVEIPDEDWLQHLHHILQQKIPSAGQLMEAVRVKMKERKVLTEELAALATPVSENA